MEDSSLLLPITELGSSRV